MRVDDVIDLAASLTQDGVPPLIFTHCRGRPVVLRGTTGLRAYLMSGWENGFAVVTPDDVLMVVLEPEHTSLIGDPRDPRAAGIRARLRPFRHTRLAWTSPSVRRPAQMATLALALQVVTMAATRFLPMALTVFLYVLFASLATGALGGVRLAIAGYSGLRLTDAPAEGSRRR